MPNDYSAFKRTPTVDELNTLSNLVHQMHDAEVEVAKAEESLKQTKEALNQIAEKQIPELMDKIGVAEFVTTDGLKVSVKKKYSATPLAANRDAAYDWLEQNGHGAMVKRSVEVGFGVRQEEDAKKLIAELSGRFNNVKSSRKVEPSTMTAWAKRMMESNTKFPEDLFNARTFDKAEVKSVS